MSVITDGNHKCVESLHKTWELNPSIQGMSQVKHLIWSKENDPQSEFGVFKHIFISDCLFFTDFHDDLIFTLQRLADIDAKIWIAAPERGSSMQGFIEKAEAHFTIQKDFCGLFTSIVDEKVKLAFE